MFVIIHGEVMQGFEERKCLILALRDGLALSRVQCWKNILRHRQQQMQSADMCRVGFIDALLIDNQEVCLKMRLEKETGLRT